MKNMEQSRQSVCDREGIQMAISDHLKMVPEGGLEFEQQEVDQQWQWELFWAEKRQLKYII